MAALWCDQGMLNFVGYSFFFCNLVFFIFYMQERVTITITIQKKTTFTGTINVTVLHKKGKESFIYTIVTTIHGIQLLIYMTANSEESIFSHKWIQFLQTTYLLHNL